MAQGQRGGILEAVRWLSTRWHEWHSRRPLRRGRVLADGDAPQLGATPPTRERETDIPPSSERRRQLRFW